MSSCFTLSAFLYKLFLFLGNYESQTVPAQWGTASELVTLYLKSLYLRNKGCPTFLDATTMKTVDHLAPQIWEKP